MTKRSQDVYTPSPKRPSVNTAGLADLFPYYAGFSYEWACDLLSCIEPTGNMVVLDPWNGSGTTTLAAQSKGLKAIGADLNPVANIVAKLRASHKNEACGELEPPTTSNARVPDVDPLCAWFDPVTAARLRQWSQYAGTEASSESAACLVAIFRLVRSVTEGFHVSNPTWVRRRRLDEDLVTLDLEELDYLITKEIQYVRKRAAEEPDYNTPAYIIHSSADCLPIRDQTVDVIVTSPPYFTRIDYAVSYSRELAVLGIDVGKDRSLRSRLMGTTLIRPSVSLSPQLSSIASDLLHAINSHPSRASSGYYIKQARQYLSDLTSSLDELTRVTRENGLLHIVVQDSYYKDIHVALADICIAELQARGWILEAQKDFIVKRIFTSLNRSAQSYDKGKVSESAISLRRAGLR